MSIFPQPCLLCHIYCIVELACTPLPPPYLCGVSVSEFCTCQRKVSACNCVVCSCCLWGLVICHSVYVLLFTVLLRFLGNCDVILCSFVGEGNLFSMSC